MSKMDYKLESELLILQGKINRALREFEGETGNRVQLKVDVETDQTTCGRVSHRASVRGIVRPKVKI